MIPELIIAADTIHTLDDDPRPYTAVAVAGGRIAALGTRGDIAGWASRGAEVVDLGSATVTPGLIDCHIHPVMGAEMTVGVGLLGASTVEELQHMLREASAGLGADDWVRGWGLDPNLFGGQPITHELIERAVGGRPTLLRLFDGHSALVSKAALNRAGITGPRQFHDGSTIVCGPDRQPTGLLHEMAAMDLIVSVMPEITGLELTRLVREALTDMARLGITGAHALEHTARASKVYAAIEDEGDLPIRLRCFPWCLPGTTASEWKDLVGMQGLSGRRWSVGGVKLFIDGTVDNGTAWLASPDTLGESLSSVWSDPETYAAAVAFLHANGVPTTTHAIGDRAVERVLEAIDAATGVSGNGIRHRIEHIETIPDAVVEQFARLSVTASMQPTHCTEYTKPDGSDNWSTRLGPERASHGWRCRDLHDAGVPVVLGSDWPIAHFDPRGVLAAAQLRRRGGEPARRPIHPEQAIGARVALEGYTSRAAWSVGEEGVAGTVSVGKRADLTAFTVDPLQADPDELASAPIALTVVDGRIQHRDDE